MEPKELIQLLTFLIMVAFIAVGDCTCAIGTFVLYVLLFDE